jgi:hypothetical protein
VMLMQDQELFFLQWLIDSGAAGCRHL